MNVTARSLNRLPGNVVTRRLAGLPSAPPVGDLDPVLRPDIATSTIEYGLVSPPPISGDLCLVAPDVLDIRVDPSSDVSITEVAFESDHFDIHEIAIDEFGVYQINGALYDRERKIGVPAEDPRVQAAAAQTGVRGRSKAAPLLARLLPILLPPARARFGEVFDLPSDLYAFQRDGIEWLREHQPGALLADEMGLGKTVQSAVALRQLFRSGEALKALIVAPRSVITTWRTHLADWAPELQVLPIDGSQSERHHAWAALWDHRAHVAVITYDSLRNDAEFAQRGELDVLILDEIQRCKNPSTATARVVRGLQARRRWGLSGTPLENTVDEFAAILAVLDPSLRFGSVPSPGAVRSAASRMMIRRRIRDVLQDLPPLVSTIAHIDLLPAQFAEYQRAEELGVARLRQLERSFVNVLALITALKQICNAVNGQSAKREWLEEYLTGAAEQGDKTLVYSQYVTTLDGMIDSLARFEPLKYTGSLAPAQRDRVVSEFQESDSRKALLVSLRAGGTGLTLTAANRVVHFDSWWNPAVMTQATARIRRIGQEKPQFETTLVAVNTIEEKIQEILDDKRTLFANVVDDLSVPGLSRALTEQELYSLFGIETRVREAVEEPRPDIEPEVQVSEPAITGPVSRATPYSNVLWIRRIIRDSSGQVWWVDPHFSRRALEDLMDELDITRVKSVRIISRDIAPKDLRDFRRFASEFDAVGIRAEWRIFETQRLFHDRFLADDSRCFNVPPVNLIYDRDAPYSEIIESGQRPPFEEWWQAATPVVTT